MIFFSDVSPGDGLIAVDKTVSHSVVPGRQMQNKLGC